MKNILAIILVGLAIIVKAQTIPSQEIQIKGALMAAPEEMRDKAMVYGYSAKGDFIVIRKGGNDLICLADDPNSPGLSTACYHKSLDPFMERGRQLKKEGKNFQQQFDAQEAEVKSGKLKMPEVPTTLFVYSADKDNYDPATGEVKEGYLRYVVYIPFATAESTGLPLKPTTPGGPWIMFPGTHRAHIMINPPKK